MIIFALFFTFCYGQQKVEGIVFDQDTKQRIAKVLVVNNDSKANVFNNVRGEFEIYAEEGDLLIAQKENYFNDTLVYEGQKVVLFNLKKTAIHIATVTVMGNKSPEQILAQRRVDYDKAYKLADPGDYFSIGQNGAGLSINAIYNLLSREGKNARRLTNYFQREYEENTIDHRFTKELVRSLTDLDGELLDNFMTRFRPDYYFVKYASHYQLLEYVKKNFEIFKINPYYRVLPNLNEIEQGK